MFRVPRAAGPAPFSPVPPSLRRGAVTFHRHPTRRSLLSGAPVLWSCFCGSFKEKSVAKDFPFRLVLVSEGLDLVALRKSLVPSY